MVDEALGIGEISGIGKSLALFEDERGLFVVDLGGHEQAYPGVGVFLAVMAKNPYETVRLS